MLDNGKEEKKTIRGKGIMISCLNDKQTFCVFAVREKRVL